MPVIVKIKNQEEAEAYLRAWIIKHDSLYEGKIDIDKILWERICWVFSVNYPKGEFDVYPNGLVDDVDEIFHAAEAEVPEGKQAEVVRRISLVEVVLIVLIVAAIPLLVFSFPNLLGPFYNDLMRFVNSLLPGSPSL